MNSNNKCIVRGKELDPVKDREWIESELGELLRGENVAFLLGAGCSIPVGGTTFGKISSSVIAESGLLDTENEGLRSNLEALLFAYRRSLGQELEDVISLQTDADYSLWAETGKAGNLEEFLSVLNNLAAGMQKLQGAQLTGLIPSKREKAVHWSDEDVLSIVGKLNLALVKALDLVPRLEILMKMQDVCHGMQKSKAAEDAPEAQATEELANSVAVLADDAAEEPGEQKQEQPIGKEKDIPADKIRAGAQAYREFMRKLAARPHNLSRVKIFTLNYDLMVEWAADREGIALIDGFRGTRERVFRPDVYDQDFFYPAGREYAEPRRLEQVVHLYKLHGSLNWKRVDSCIENPFGVSAICGDLPKDEKKAGEVVIYPNPGKYGATLELPYAEMFRRFAEAVVRPQSTLIVIGYSGGDDHVQAIIRQALMYPSFTLVLVNPSTDPIGFLGYDNKIPTDDKSGKSKYDTGVWVLKGENGTFAKLIDLLPDLLQQKAEREILARRAEF